ncbi:MAG: hypothetical protein FIB02_08505 [Desulfuromonas sp.]|nr:hypothetical protein [Desulfuromonas sp.]
MPPEKKRGSPVKGGCGCAKEWLPRKDLNPEELPVRIGIQPGILAILYGLSGHGASNFVVDIIMAKICRMMTDAESKKKALVCPAQGEQLKATGAGMVG